MGEQSLSIFFNGSFKKEQEDVSYEGGNHIVMPIQASELSHQYILDLLSGIGCNSIEVVRYRIPGRTLVDGLRLIIDEFDVRSLISHFSICNNIELYIQHSCGDGSIGESSRRGNAVEEEIDSEEDDDYIGGSSEDSDEELMEARRALKLAKQRSVIRTKQVDHESGNSSIVTGDDDAEYEPSDVEDNASDETNYSEGKEMDDFEVVEGGGSGEEEIVRVRNRFPIYDSKSKEPVFCVSMVFDGPKEFRDAIKKHSIAVQREIVFKKMTNKGYEQYVPSIIVHG